MPQPHQAEDIVHYHSARAAEELQSGLTAANLAAARAHFRLATMHSERVRALQPSSSHYRPLLRMSGL